MMRKWMKIFAGTVLSVSLLAGAVAFTACNGTSDSASTGTSASTSGSTGSSVQEKEGYKFTVLYPNGDPVVGVKVQVCIGDELCLTPVPTDANGFALIEEEPTVYDIHLLNIPEGYAFNGPYKTAATYEEITLRLVEAAAE